jgi:hypothetical protein
MVLVGFFELAQSSGSEQNNVSTELKPLYEGTFFNLRSGADREKPNQINGLSSGIEDLKQIFMAGQLRFEQSLLSNPPIHLPHHALNLLIDALHAFLPAGIGTQPLFPPQSP